MQKLLTILLVVPIVFGIFGSVALAVGVQCETKSACESLLSSAESTMGNLRDDIKDLEEQLGVAADREEAESIFAELKAAIAKRQKFEKDTYAPLKIATQSFASVDSRKILTIDGQNQFKNLSDFVGGVIDLLVKMVAVIAFALLVVGGFRLVAAAGNDNEIQKAKTMITYSIIGLVVVLLAYLIVLLAQTILYH